MDMIKTADYVIDLGHEGGDGGILRAQAHWDILNHGII